jgi:hypothetical protein
MHVLIIKEKWKKKKRKKEKKIRSWENCVNPESCLPHSFPNLVWRE